MTCTRVQSAHLSVMVSAVAAGSPLLGGNVIWHVVYVHSIAISFYHVGPLAFPVRQIVIDRSAESLLRHYASTEGMHNQATKVVLMAFLGRAVQSLQESITSTPTRECTVDKDHASTEQLRGAPLISRLVRFDSGAGRIAAN